MILIIGLYRCFMSWLRTKFWVQRNLTCSANSLKTSENQGLMFREITYAITHPWVIPIVIPLMCLVSTLQHHSFGGVIAITPLEDVYAHHCHLNTNCALRCTVRAWTPEPLVGCKSLWSVGMTARKIHVTLHENTLSKNIMVPKATLHQHGTGTSKYKVSHACNVTQHQKTSGQISRLRSSLISLCGCVPINGLARPCSARGKAGRDCCHVSHTSTSRYTSIKHGTS